MNLQFSESKFGDLNLGEIKSLFQACKWDWLEPDEEMHLAFKGSFRLYTVSADGQLAGFGRLVSDGKIYGLLVDCMVLPDLRRQGIGKALVDFIIAQSKKNGLKVIQLLASSEGLPIYEKAGFKRCPSSSPGMIKFLAHSATKNF